MFMKKINSFVLLIFLFSCFGCRSNLPHDLPKLYPCKIVVTQKDAPLEGATVILQRIDPAEGQTWLPMAMTDTTGTAVLSTNGRYPGAPLGKYKILVSKRITERVGPKPPTDDELSPEYQAWSMMNSGAMVPPTDLVELQYGDAEKTPLEIEVVKGTNELTVDVGKPVKIRMKY